MVMAKETLTKDPGLLEELNTRWGGDQLSVERAHEFGFSRCYFIKDSGKFQWEYNELWRCKFPMVGSPVRSELVSMFH